jgi:hypothetical protein
MNSDAMHPCHSFETAATLLGSLFEFICDLIKAYKIAKLVAGAVSCEILVEILFQ